MWGSDTAPVNHQPCLGQEVSRTDYPEVFALLGTRFGAGNGSTTFQLPAMQGRAAFGVWPGGSYGTFVGQAMGRADTALPSHQHVTPDHLHGVNIWTSYAGAHYHTPSPPGENFITNGSGGVGADVMTGGGGYMFDTLTSQSDDHRHAVNGMSDPADRSLATSWTGEDASVGNIPPAITLHFMMRMH